MRISLIYLKWAFLVNDIPKVMSEPVCVLSGCVINELIWSFERKVCKSFEGKTEYGSE